MGNYHLGLGIVNLFIFIYQFRHLVIIFIRLSKFETCWRNGHRAVSLSHCSVTFGCQTQSHSLKIRMHEGESQIINEGTSILRILRVWSVWSDKTPTPTACQCHKVNKVTLHYMSTHPAQMNLSNHPSRSDELIQSPTPLRWTYPISLTYGSVHKRYQ